jgi:hypothetical protein
VVELCVLTVLDEVEVVESVVQVEVVVVECVLRVELDEVELDVEVVDVVVGLIHSDTDSDINIVSSTLPCVLLRSCILAL